MRWQQGRRSDNIQDIRVQGGSPVLAGGVGLIGVLLALVVALLGGDPFVVLKQMGGSQLSQAPVVVSGPRRPQSAADDQLAPGLPGPGPALPGSEAGDL